jgi:hypothetical protein
MDRRLTNMYNYGHQAWAQVVRIDRHKLSTAFYGLMLCNTMYEITKLTTAIAVSTAVRLPISRPIWLTSLTMNHLQFKRVISHLEKILNTIFCGDSFTYQPMRPSCHPLIKYIKKRT